MGAVSHRVLAGRQVCPAKLSPKRASAMKTAPVQLPGPCAFCEDETKPAPHRFGHLHNVAVLKGK
jgi:hypothetical protein